MNPGRWWMRNLLRNGHGQQLLWCFTVAVKLIIQFQKQRGERNHWGPFGISSGLPDAEKSSPLGAPAQTSSLGAVVLPRTP